MRVMDSGAGSTVESATTGLAPSRCPVAHDGPPPASTAGAPVRSRADQIVRTVLRVRERPPGMSEHAAHVAFQRSMTISAMRCTLTYLVFPILLPLVGIRMGVGPAIGIAIGVAAMVCDVFAIRRFFAVDHRWRWPFTALISSVLVLLAVLLVDDISHLT